MTKPSIVVVGAGVFGAWTAHHLHQRGARVTLVDAFGPAHSRASSGGESRIIRAAYGKDAIYSRMAIASLPQWQALGADAGLPIFHPTGVLFFFRALHDYFRDTLAVHRDLGLPTELLERPAMAARFPMIDFDGVEAGLFEPGFGTLMARRAVQTLVDRFVRVGGDYRTGAVRPPREGSGPLSAINLASGETLEADRFVFAAGPWLPKLFPALLAGRIRPTRQEVFFFAPPPGDPSFEPGTMPVWADFNDGDMFYGFPDIEARGVKFAHDVHGPEVDPDMQDRRPGDAALAEVVAYRDRRFPALRGAPLTEARVCQYENSSSGDFLVDFHPAHPNVLLLGAGSGHGFKHGPAVGAHAASLVLDDGVPEPRFGLSTKSAVHDRQVI